MTRESHVTDDPGARQRAALHRLRVESLDLVGGGRQVLFVGALNYVTGEITTGKSTFVRLVRGLLGKVPSGLPRETEHVRAFRAEVITGTRYWAIYRPNVTTATAPVEVAEIPDGETRRIPAQSGPDSYSSFLLGALDLPDVAVPRARQEPDAKLSPVTMTDWLSYCIVTGEDIDHNVFGSNDHWKDQKRRWVFELVYGLYDVKTLKINAEIRRTELALDALGKETEILGRFLEGTPLADLNALKSGLDEKLRELKQLDDRDQQTASRTPNIPEVFQLQRRLQAARLRYGDSQTIVDRLGMQVLELEELRAQLKAQISKLTRALTAVDYLVDFDFIVCPRCGNEVQAHRAEVGRCYLCLQKEHLLDEKGDEEALLQEQERLVAQVEETDRLLTGRQGQREQARAAVAKQESEIQALAEALNVATRDFVSDEAEQLKDSSANRARLRSETTNLKNYIQIAERVGQHDTRVAQLSDKLSNLEDQRDATSDHESESEKLIVGLEARILEYLQRLRVPHLADLLTVRINRTTYMPEVSGRQFTELSSEGMKTLVNIAHALAHHTYAIDKGLPLPGLLVLDGVSANAGSEGYDRARVLDAYALLEQEAQKYADQLQIIVVDNIIPNEVLLRKVGAVVLTLTHQDKLIRIPGASTTKST